MEIAVHLAVACDGVFELSFFPQGVLDEILNLIESVSEGFDIWKQVNITPIFKKDGASDPSYYRLISLLSCIGKVLEKFVHKYVLTSRDNAVITALQSGFMPGDSTVN